MGKYSLHIHLSSEVMKIFKHKRLDDLAHMEQDAATGRNEKGDKVKGEKLEKALGALLAESGISAEDKARMIMVVATARGGLSNEDKTRLLQQAGVPVNSVAGKSVDSLTRLLATVPPLTSAEKDEKEKREKREKKKRKDEDEEDQYVLSRYRPKLKEILSDFVDGKLSSEVWPYAGDQAAEPAQKKEEVSLKSKPASNWAAEKGKGPVSAKEDSTPLLGSRIVVFVLGGASYSELRVAYEVMHEAHRDVLIGGPCVFTAKSFMEALSQ